MKPMHKGVGLLISNLDGSRFFIQQKDESYPYEEWRNCCSFWGGAIEEEDASELVAVHRELEEEIPDTLELLLPMDKKIIGKYKIPTFDSAFWLTVFVVQVTNAELDKIATTKVLEGRGVLFSRVEALAQKWIWNTDFIFHDYMKSKDL